MGMDNMFRTVQDTNEAMKYVLYSLKIADMKIISYRVVICVLVATLTLLSTFVFAQPVMETGGQKMPDEWIDNQTKHKVIRLSRIEGNSSLSFYFHNNPFIGNKMVFYSSGKNDVSGVQKQEIYSTNSRNKQIWLLDLSTLKSEQLTHQASPMNG